MNSKVKRIHEHGAALIDYSLLVVFIAVALIVGLNAFGHSVAKSYCVSAGRVVVMDSDATVVYGDINGDGKMNCVVLRPPSDLVVLM